MIANQETGTRVDEVAAGIYRISTPLDVIPGGFTLNSYLIDDDEPLLFHAGYRKLFSNTLEAVQKVMPVERLRWIGGSHFEGDEYGALNEFLTVAPKATPFGTEIGVLTSINDFAIRDARGLGDGEEFSIGGRRLKWMYTPHVPHGWDCGVLFDLSTGTLLCGDLFTQPGAGMAPVTETEVLSASETMRGMMDYYAHATSTTAILGRLAKLHPSMLACQHGSAYRGDGASLLRELAITIEKESGKLPGKRKRLLRNEGPSKANDLRVAVQARCRRSERVSRDDASQQADRPRIYTRAMRHCAPGALLFLVFTSSLTFAQTGVEAKSATAAEAQEFVDRANAELLKLAVNASHAQWTAETFITEDTEATSALLNEQSTAHSLALIEESHRFDHVTLPPELRRQIKLLQVNAPAAPKDPKLLAEETQLAAQLQACMGRANSAWTAHRERSPSRARSALESMRSQTSWRSRATPRN